jgi:hypothetical protein
MRFYFWILVFCLIFSSIARPIFAADHFWQIQSIDTMKYSRDRARDRGFDNQIPLLVSKVVSLHPTHIAINTPYDAEFMPVLRIWVQAARQQGLKVWFRGNFSGWEGWFGYPKFTDPAIHHRLTRDFILSNADLFSDGDLFTPAPEPENGGFGDPRKSLGIKTNFESFLTTSYANCTQAFLAISQSVRCGLFSVNGDVAKIISPATIAATGNVLVIDHYVKSPQVLISDIQFLYSKHRVPIILGEVGLPIPNIHGPLDDQAQADLIQSFFLFISREKNVTGINYWTAFDGSTALFKEDLSIKPAGMVVSSFYNPLLVSGIVKSPLGKPVTGAKINGLYYTDENGYFSFPAISTPVKLIIEKPGYVTQRIASSTTPGPHKITLSWSLAIHDILSLVFDTKKSLRGGE